MYELNKKNFCIIYGSYILCCDRIIFFKSTCVYRYLSQNLNGRFLQHVKFFNIWLVYGNLHCPYLILHNITALLSISLSLLDKSNSATVINIYLTDLVIFLLISNLDVIYDYMELILQSIMLNKRKDIITLNQLRKSKKDKQNPIWYLLERTSAKQLVNVV